MVLEKLYKIYGLEPLDIKENEILDVFKLDVKYQYLFSTIFYPKTIIYRKDILYVENFWENRQEEFEAYTDLVNILKEPVIDPETRVSSTFDVKISIAHFRDIGNITGLAMAIDGNIIQKEIIIPEDFIKDKSIINMRVNYVAFLRYFYETSVVKLNLDVNSYQKLVNKPNLLIIDKDSMSKYYLLPRGYKIGQYSCTDEMIAIYLYSRLFLCYIEDKKWFEKQIKMEDIACISNIIFKKIMDSNSKKNIKDIIGENLLDIRNSGEKVEIYFKEVKDTFLEDIEWN